MTALVLICARCQRSLAPGQAREVDEEQGTSASLAWVCLDNPDCWPQYTRRHDGTV